MIPSEKTLEINFVRNFYHSYHFIWRGTTLPEEAKVGWDSGIDNLIPGKSFILQFKRPYMIKKPNTSETLFTFWINNNSTKNQNQLLSDIAQMYGPMNIFYALPCVENLVQLENPREAILWRTALLDVHQSNLTNLSNKSHKVEITYKHHITNPTFTGVIYSEPRRLEITTVHDYKTWRGFSLDDLKRLYELKTSKYRGARVRVKVLTELHGQNIETV